MGVKDVIEIRVTREIPDRVRQRDIVDHNERHGVLCGANCARDGEKDNRQCDGTFGVV